MYGDAERLRTEARALTQSASELNDLAQRLMATAVTARWQSSAADAMRQRMRREAALLRAVAAELAGAGSSLSRHAAAVEAMQARIRAIERTAHALLQAALRVASSVLAAATQAGDDLAVRLRALMSRLPPPGHLDWLGVPDQLRGLGLTRGG